MRNKILITIIVLIFLMSLYSSWIIQSPVKGKVLNAITNETIEGFNIKRHISIGDIEFNPGGSYGYTKWVDYQKSEKDGNYYFPWTIRFTTPLIHYFDDVRFSPCTCHEFVGKCITKDIEDYECKNDQFIGKYHDDYYFISGKTSIINRGKGLFPGNGLISQSRFKLTPKEFDIYLVPFIEDINECDKIKITELKYDCQLLNAERLAAKTENIKLCDLIKNADWWLWTKERIISCKIEVAKKTGDKKICDNLPKEGDSGPLPYIQNNCLIDVSTATQNKTLCESILSPPRTDPPSEEYLKNPKNMVWRDYGNNTGKCDYPTYPS